MVSPKDCTEKNTWDIMGSHNLNWMNKNHHISHPNNSQTKLTLQPNFFHEPLHLFFSEEAVSCHGQKIEKQNAVRFRIRKKAGDELESYAWTKTSIVFCSREPGSKLVVLGMAIPPLIGILIMGI